MQVTVVAGERQHHLTIPIAPKLNTTIVIESCGWCREPFVVRAPHQMFCSPACRMSSFRKEEQQQAAGA
jgi:hypothetical protein